MSILIMIKTSYKLINIIWTKKYKMKSMMI